MRVPRARAPQRRRHRRPTRLAGMYALLLPHRTAASALAAVLVVCASVLVVEQVGSPPVQEPWELALLPLTPEPRLTVPAGLDGAADTTAPTSTPEPDAEPKGAGEAVKEPAPEPEPAPAVRPGGPAPNGLPWRSGIVGGPPGEVAAWEDYRGRPVDVIHAFTARGNWEDIETAGWILGYYADSPAALVISQPFWPEGSGGSLEECASGAYDANWAEYGSSLSAAGRTDAYTRLAWEFNGDWFEWSATDVGAWKECFRRVVGAVRSTAPDARFEWNLNAHGSQTSEGDAWKSYPGDDVVDVVGIDPYDHYPASPTAAEFDEQCRDSHGLCAVIDFARAHGKGVGVTEWGVIRSGAGDNPLYIEKMFETFMNGADVMEYETYFNEEDFGNALTAPVQNPASSRTYRELFGG